MKFSAHSIIFPAFLVSYAAPAYAVQYVSVEEAQKLLFPGATTFSSSVISLSEPDSELVQTRADVNFHELNIPVWKVSSGQKFLGYFFIDDVIGKHEKITYAAAFSPDRKVIGIEIIEYRENRGFEIRDREWRQQFVGKSSADPIILDQDIKNITGATFSCKHITEGVRKLAQILEVAHEN